MSTITPLNNWDSGNTFRTNLNTNLSNLNTDKLEASDIADFETTTELNARDTANRARTNHTGTQTLSTISDAGTSAALDVAATGDAAAGEVVKGNDTRLTDARTPKAHTHTASEITDFDTEVSNNTSVTANTAKVSADGSIDTHSDINTTGKANGNVLTYNSTSGDWEAAAPTGGWASALNDLSDVTIATPSNGQALIYNSTSWDWKNTTLWGGGDMLAATYDPTSVAGDAFDMDNMVEGTTNKILTAAERTTISNQSWTNTGDQTITLTGDVTGSGTGSFAATIADEAVTLPKMAHIATNRILGRSTAGTGDVESLADGAVKDIIGLATTDSPQFAGLNVWHATDTTIGRTSAWVINVEGDNVLMDSNIWVDVQAHSSVLDATTASFTTADETKLDGIEAWAEVNEVTLAWSETLTNKDLTSWTNTFPTFNQDTTGKSASTDALNSATTTVNVSSATAPTAGQVLTATSPTTATWQDAWGGWGGWFNIEYPHDITSWFQAWWQEISSINTYTVPTWKVLYITQALSDNSAPILALDGNKIFNSWYSAWWDYFRTLVNPIIAAEWVVVSALTTTVCYSYWFICDENTNISPVIISSNYTVPAGKILILNNIYAPAVSVIFNINGTSVSAWSQNLWINQSDISMNVIHKPILLNASDTITVSSGAVYSWYLIPDDFTI